MLELLDVYCKSMALNHAFRKLELNTKYNAYLKKFPLKYDIRILEGGEPEFGKTCFIILEHSLEVPPSQQLSIAMIFLFSLSILI